MLVCQNETMTLSTEPWGLSGLVCESIASCMLKVESLNPGAAVYAVKMFARMFASSAGMVE